MAFLKYSTLCNQTIKISKELEQEGSSLLHFIGDKAEAEVK